MVCWVVEQQRSNERRQGWNDQIQQACTEIGARFIDIRIVPFIHEIDGSIPIINETVVVYGSTAMINVARKHDWQPGVFSIYNESDTMKAIGKHYLNRDMRVLEVDQVTDYVSSTGMEYFFAKPDKDLKSFDGTVFDVERFPFFIENAKQYHNYDPETKICVSSIKHPEQEWRFVIVDRRVVASSLYRVERKLTVGPCVDEHAIEFANYIAEFASPSGVYVMDVCLIRGTYKVIEYNTFNCSGLYACNVRDIVQNVTAYIGSNQ